MTTRKRLRYQSKEDEEREGENGILPPASKRVSS